MVMRHTSDRNKVHMLSDSRADRFLGQRILHKIRSDNTWAFLRNSHEMASGEAEYWAKICVWHTAILYKFGAQKAR